MECNKRLWWRLSLCPISFRNTHWHNRRIIQWPSFVFSHTVLDADSFIDRRSVRWTRLIDMEIWVVLSICLSMKRSTHRFCANGSLKDSLTVVRPKMNLSLRQLFHDRRRPSVIFSSMCYAIKPSYISHYIIWLRYQHLDRDHAKAS